jgi:hypothetical protein
MERKLGRPFRHSSDDGPVDIGSRLFFLHPSRDVGDTCSADERGLSSGAIPNMPRTSNHLPTLHIPSDPLVTGNFFAHAHVQFSGI